jgi:hypothetical protein
MEDEKENSSMLYWIIGLIFIIFVFGPMIMNMFNNSDNRFGVEEIGSQTVTNLLSNT